MQNCLFVDFLFTISCRIKCDLRCLHAADTMASNDSSAPSTATGIISSRVWRDSISISIAQRPRLICVQPHQRINFTLVDFSVDDPTSSIALKPVGRQPAADCSDPLVIIGEGDDIDNGTVICGGHRRRSSVYLSTSNCVRILLNATETRTAEFLIYYEGIDYHQSKHQTNQISVSLPKLLTTL